MAGSRLLFLGDRRTLPEGLSAHDCASALATAHTDLSVEVVETPVSVLDTLDETVVCVVNGRPLDDGGLEFLRDLRDRDETVPVVYLPTTPTEHVPIDAISLGVTEYCSLRSVEDPLAALSATVETALSDRAVTDRSGPDTSSPLAGSNDETPTSDIAQCRELVENIADPVYMIDDAGYVEMANEALLEQSGFSREEFIGKHVTEVMPPEDVERGTEIILDLLQSDEQTSDTFEMEIIHADGSRREYEDHVSVLYDEDGTYAGSVGIVRDIEERKARERELEQYETIVETVPDGVFVLDEHGVLVGGNARGAEILGYDRESVLGLSVRELVDAGVLDSDAIEAYSETVSDLVSSDADADAGRIEFTISANGTDEERIFEARIALRPYDEHFRGTVGVIQDITDRQQRIEELERYETIVQAIPDTLWSADEHGYFTFINEAGVEQWGHPKSEMDNGEVHFSEIAADEDIEKFEEALVRLLSEEYETDGNAVVQYTGIRKDGRRFPAETYLSPMEPTEEGVPSAGIARDISDRKQREERIEVLDRVLRHNLRNDCNAILANAELLVNRLRERYDDEQGARIADITRKQTEQLVEVSRNVRQIQQALERDRMEHPEIDAVEVVDRVIEAFQTTDTAATIDADLPDRAVVEADDSLALVVENLLENAIVHHDRDDPTVDLTITERDHGRGEWYEITISDDGPGIPEQELVAVEEGRDVTPLQHGSGIGLWAVTWIVQSFDGEVDIDADDTGSTVTVTLRKAT